MSPSSDWNSSWGLVVDGGIGTGGGGMVRGTGTEAIGERSWAMEGGGGLVVPVGNWLGDVGTPVAALGQGGFSVVISGVVGDCRSSAAGRMKLGGGPQVWLLNRTRHGDSSGLVNAEVNWMRWMVPSPLYR